MRLVCDTSVLVDFLCGEPRAMGLLEDRASSGDELWGVVVTRVELLAGMRSAARRATRALLDSLRWLDLDVELADRAGELARRYRRSHRRIELPDYVVAGTGLLGATLLTQNVRHSPVPGFESMLVVSRHDATAAGCEAGGVADSQEVPMIGASLGLGSGGAVGVELLDGLGDTLSDGTLGETLSDSAADAHPASAKTHERDEEGTHRIGQPSHGNVVPTYPARAAVRLRRTHRDWPRIGTAERHRPIAPQVRTPD